MFYIEEGGMKDIYWGKDDSYCFIAFKSKVFQMVRQAAIDIIS